MSAPRIYLAGPIAGLTKGEANDWRKYVIEKLSPHGIVGVSPLRSEPLIGERYNVVYDDPRFGTPNAIRAKNVIDVNTCNATLEFLPKWANDLRPSYGTVTEHGMSLALGKPIILVSDDPYVLKHPLVGDAAQWRLGTLDEAIDVIVGTFGVYVDRRAA